MAILRGDARLAVEAAVALPGEEEAADKVEVVRQPHRAAGDEDVAPLQRRLDVGKEPRAIGDAVAIGDHLLAVGIVASHAAGVLPAAVGHDLQQVGVGIAELALEAPDAHAGHVVVLAGAFGLGDDEADVILHVAIEGVQLVIQPVTGGGVERTEEAEVDVVTVLRTQT